MSVFNEKLNNIVVASNLTLLGLTLFLMPVLNVIYQPLALGWLAILAAYSFVMVAANGQKVFNTGLSKYQLIFVAKLAVIAVLAAVHSRDSLPNLGGIAMADGSMVLFSILCASTGTLNEKSLRLVCLMMLAILIAYIPMSMAMSKFMAVNDPIRTFVFIHRLQLMCPPLVGHSVVITYTAIPLLLILSRQVKFGAFRWPMIAIFTIFMAASGTSTAMLMILATFGIWALSLRVKSPPIVLAIMGVSAAIVLLFGQSILEFVRFSMQGANAADYHGDLTAGRALLNQLMWDTARQAPVFGKGAGDDVIQYGVGVMMDTDGKYVATVESTLRLAAKYGFIFFTTVAVTVLYPIVQVVTGKFKLEGPTLGALMFISGIVISALSNSVFEASTEYDYWIDTLLLLYYGYTLQKPVRFLVKPRINARMQIPKALMRIAGK